MNVISNRGSFNVVDEAAGPSYSYPLNPCDLILNSRCLLQDRFDTLQAKLVYSELHNDKKTNTVNHSSIALTRIIRFCYYIYEGKWQNLFDLDPKKPIDCSQKFMEKMAVPANRYSLPATGQMAVCLRCVLFRLR